MNKISRAGKVAHDLGLSTWFGGTLFGQVSLNPTVSSISDQRERGRVLNEAWARFQAANIPAMLSTLLGWRLGGVRDDAQLRAPGLTRAKDVLLGGAAFNTVASALLPQCGRNGFPRGCGLAREGRLRHQRCETQLPGSFCCRLQCQPIARDHFQTDVPEDVVSWLGSLFTLSCLGCEDQSPRRFRYSAP